MTNQKAVFQVRWSCLNDQAILLEYNTLKVCIIFKSESKFHCFGLPSNAYLSFKNMKLILTQIFFVCSCSYILYNSRRKLYIKLLILSAVMHHDTQLQSAVMHHDTQLTECRDASRYPTSECRDRSRYSTNECRDRSRYPTYKSRSLIS